MRATPRPLVAISTAGAVAATLLVGSPVIADADTATAAITNAAPGALETVIRGETAAAIDGMAVKIPTDAEEGVSTSAPGVDVNIGLPFATAADIRKSTPSGLSTFDNNNGSISVPVVHDDGSVQIFTVIDRASAPTRYGYKLTLPAGVTLAEAEDGALTIVAADGGDVGYIAAPWAKDANNVDLPTRYELNGTTLTQVVDHAGAAFPVTADPWFGFKLINSAKWITRDKRGKTLVVSPTTFNRINSGDGNVKREGWSEVKRLQPSASTNNMQWQYECHFVFAAFKSTWNLDTWVRRTGYTDSVAHKCN